MSAMSMTADAARRALEAAKGDDEFVRRYLAGDKAAFQHMQGLLQAAYPDDGSGDTGGAADDRVMRAPAAPATPAGDGDGAAMPQWLLDAGDAGFAPPKSAAHYQFDYAPNVEIDPEFDRQARDWMYKAELPAGWAAEITRDYQRRAAKPPAEDEIAQEREAVLGRLRRDWGDATDQKLAQVRDLVRGIGDDRLAETLDRSGLGNNEWLIRQLAIHADRKAAKAAERGDSEASEDSESNGDTGAAHRDIGYPPGDDDSGPYVQLADNSGGRAMGETVGPETAPIGETEEAAGDQSLHDIDLLMNLGNEDGARRQIGRAFGPDVYARTDTPPPPPGIGVYGLFRFGNWTGKSFSGKHTSPSFLALTDAKGNVLPMRNADGKFNLLDNVSKKHDLAYDAAQQKLLDDLENPNKSAQRAFADYYLALAKADREFLADISSGNPDLGTLSGDPWETEVIRRAKQAFEYTAWDNEKLGRAHDQSDHIAGGRQSALVNARFKLIWLSHLVKGHVVGQRVKTVQDELRNRLIEAGGGPYVPSYGKAFAYVNSPEEAEAAYERRKRAR